jgi:hypothetical protein
MDVDPARPCAFEALWGGPDGGTTAQEHGKSRNSCVIRVIRVSPLWREGLRIGFLIDLRRFMRHRCYLRAETRRQRAGWLLLDLVRFDWRTSGFTGGRRLYETQGLRQSREAQHGTIPSDDATRWPRSILGNPSGRASLSRFRSLR